MIKKIGRRVLIEILIGIVLYIIITKTSILLGAQERINNHLRHLGIWILTLPIIITLRDNEGTKKWITIIVRSISIYAIGDIILREYAWFSLGQYILLYGWWISILGSMYIRHRIRFVLTFCISIILLGVLMTKILPWYTSIRETMGEENINNEQIDNQNHTQNWTIFLLNPTVNHIMGGYIHLLNKINPTTYQQVLENYQNIQPKITPTTTNSGDTPNIFQTLREQTKKWFQATSWYQDKEKIQNQ